MALIERVSLNDSPAIADRSVTASDDASSRQEKSVERVAGAMPGLRIRSRLTTSSLSDYALYDLKTLIRAERGNTVTDGESS